MTGIPNRNARLLPGDHAPWFVAPALDGRPDFVFATVAGRYILLLLHGTASNEASREALALVARERALFDDGNASFFGVTIDPEDAAQGRIAQDLPGIRHFLDYDGAASIACGALPAGSAGATAQNYDQHWLLIDRALQVVGSYPIEMGEHAIAALRREINTPVPAPWAPVLLVPRIFEPELCQHLVSLYETQGGTESGFMREVNGQTKLLVDPTHKRRADCEVNDRALRDAIAARIRRRLIPRLQFAFQFKATRMERYIVACYDGESGGYFRPHRDNTTGGTAHRRFAVTINLNSEEYDGGELRFPEFGNRTYRAPTGGAIVFSCSMLHEATPVTRGRRYAFLPFLYDEEAAKLREENNKFLAPELTPYRAG